MRHSPGHFQRNLLATLIATFVHGFAVADEVQLPSITVTASPLKEDPTPKSSVIDAGVLRSLRPATSDTATLLKFVPGVSIQGSGGAIALFQMPLPVTRRLINACKKKRASVNQAAAPFDSLAIGAGRIDN